MVRLELVKCTLCDLTLYSTVHRKANGEPLNGTALLFHSVVQLNVKVFLLTRFTPNRYCLCTFCYMLY